MSTITLLDAEHMELSQKANSRAGRADDARRARLILLLAAAHTWEEIRDKLDCNDAFIARWSRRFGQERLAVLAGTQNRLILGAKRGFLESVWERDIHRLPLGIRQPSEAIAAESRGCLASERGSPAEQANAMPEILENASIPRKRRNSILINRRGCSRAMLGRVRAP